MANLDNLGTQPFGKDPSYKVFRNVKSYGAKGDGVTVCLPFPKVILCCDLTQHQDDTAAINKAIADGNRCGENCYGSSVIGVVVYFPFGMYFILLCSAYELCD